MDRRPESSKTLCGVGKGLNNALPSCGLVALCNLKKLLLGLCKQGVKRLLNIFGLEQTVAGYFAIKKGFDSVRHK